MSHCKRLVPIYIQEPHFVSCLGRIRIFLFALGIKPAGTFFIGKAKIQCIVSTVDSVIESDFQCRGIHGLHGNFCVIDEIVGISLNSGDIYGFSFRPGTGNHMLYRHTCRLRVSGAVKSIRRGRNPLVIFVFTVADGQSVFTVWD